MVQNSISGRIRWSFSDGNPVIAPGQLHADMDSRRAGAAHVVQLGDRYRMYYWGTGANGFHRILIAESPVDEPNDWKPVGVALSRQRDTAYNDEGPGFPFVVPRDDGPWLLYFCGWGKPREDGKLPIPRAWQSALTAGTGFAIRIGNRFCRWTGTGTGREPEAYVSCGQWPLPYVLYVYRGLFQPPRRCCHGPRKCYSPHRCCLCRIAGREGVDKAVNGLMVGPRGFDTRTLRVHLFEALRPAGTRRLPDVGEYVRHRLSDEESGRTGRHGLALVRQRA